MICEHCHKENRSIAKFCKWCGRPLAGQNVLDKLVGLAEVKTQLKTIVDTYTYLRSRKDIANVRLTFENGCVANLTASRISMKNMRKIRLFQDNAYISMDLLEKKTEMIHIENVTGDVDDPFAMILDLGENKGKKRIIIDTPKIETNNAIRSELESFIHSIDNQFIPEVSLHDGYQALKTAYKIIEKMNCNIK